MPRHRDLHLVSHHVAAFRVATLLCACVPSVACFAPTDTTDQAGGATSGSVSATDGIATEASASNASMGDASASDASASNATVSDESSSDGSATTDTPTTDTPTTDAPTTDTPTEDSGESGGDPTTDGSSSSGPGNTTDDPTDDPTGGVPACDGQCTPEVPQGWQGPVVVYDGVAAPGACPSDFPELVHDDQHAGLDEGAAVCDCDCGAVVGASCGAATLREEGNLCIAFVMNPDTFVLQPGACTLINAPANDYSLTPSALQTAGASCSPQATENITPPSWDRHVRSCGAEAGDACDGGTCFPDVPADHSMCIWVEGEAACPAGPWSEVLVSYTDAVDSRDCTTCTCGTPTGSCGGDAYLTNAGCAGGAVLVDIMPANGCGDLQSATHGQWVPEVNASCAPSGGALTGDVDVAGAVTYCCL